MWYALFDENDKNMQQTCSETRSLFHKILRIRKLRICSYGQILTANLLINAKIL